MQNVHWRFLSSHRSTVRQSGSWIEYANRFAACGADAIELNHYVVAADVEVDGTAIEKEYLSLVKTARKQIKLP
jgi:dihydroorotate dehydrogenase (fumarate)